MTADAVAIIPARGGSKGVPRKNLRPFMGEPLVVHSIRHALSSSRVGRVVVSTDDPEIAQAAAAAGAEVCSRPAAISGDAAPSEPALLHAVEAVYPDARTRPRLVVFLQATSPIRDPGDIDAAVAELDRTRADSLLSVCPSHDFHWTLRDGHALPLNYDPAARPRRQDLPPQFRENGSLYVMKTAGLMEHRCRLFGRVALYVMDQVRSFQIDTLEDFHICEALASCRSGSQERHRVAQMPMERAEV